MIEKATDEKKITLKVHFFYALYKQLIFFFIIIIIFFLPEIIKYNNLLNEKIVNNIINTLYIINGLIMIKIAYGLIYYKLLKYELFKDCLIVKEGVFTNRINFLELYRVKDYSVYQSFFMKLFNMMSIQLITSDKSTPILNINGIPKSEVFNLIREYVEEQRIIKGVREFD
jgi:membrane protein YdbS with pleckstrin-like domain